MVITFGSLQVASVKSLLIMPGSVPVYFAFISLPSASVKSQVMVYSLPEIATVIVPDATPLLSWPSFTNEYLASELIVLSPDSAVTLYTPSSRYWPEISSVMLLDWSAVENVASM